MKSRRIAWVIAVVLAVCAAGGTWLYAQQRAANPGTFGPIAANPSYIVVNTATPVVFTAQITDPKLKKRSVVLVRLDADGQPFDILGRLRDDGKNGDAAAGDRIYSLRTSLNEPTVGPVNFKIAARFKPGKWSEPEADDDDWDAELAITLSTERDQPAEKSKRERRLKKLARYSLSGLVVVTIDPFKLPPDPGEAGKQTLEGIDSDNDGVRDDVQRWITLGHPSPAERVYLTHLARTQQQALLDTGNRQASQSHALELMSLYLCGEQHFGVSVADDYRQNLLFQMLNTASRSRAYLARDIGSIATALTPSSNCTQ